MRASSPAGAAVPLRSCPVGAVVPVVLSGDGCCPSGTGGQGMRETFTEFAESATRSRPRWNSSNGNW